MIKHSRFKRLVALASVAALSLSLGACAGGSTVLQNDIAAVEQQAQADANVLCGFIPTIATVAAFIPGFGTAVASASTIATGICAAIAQAPVVSPASSVRLKSIASGTDTQVATAKTPGGPVSIVGHFTR